jgi:FkbM family methyltransferase
MNLSWAVRRLVPEAIKNLVRQRRPGWRLSKLLSPFLPDTVCVDVGASYYPHIKWQAFLNAPRTQWLAVEPNESNIGYIKSWAWSSQVSSCTTGLSRDGGTQTLYVTNVDSGSSLLPPEIPPSMQHRVSNLDYYFPLTECRIETLTLVQAQAGLSSTAPVFVKLDTQGTELSILQGAQILFDTQRIVGIEMESTLLAQPVMKGSGKFWEACEYLESQGFELLHIQPIHALPRRPRRSKALQYTYLNECDAVFALRPDVVAELAVEYRVGLLAFYVTNLFYEEALSLLERDVEAAAFLHNQGCSVNKLVDTLKAAVG